jgi:hypothetical protein
MGLCYNPFRWFFLIFAEAYLTAREGIGERLRKAIQWIGVEATRASGFARTKMHLNRLQIELREREGTLGRKLAQLKRKGVVKDKFILEALKEEFESLADCERRIESVLYEIQGLAILETVEKPGALPKTPSDDQRSGLDSFEVS